MPFAPLLGYEYVLLVQARNGGPSRWPIAVRSASLLLASIFFLRAGTGVADLVSTWTLEGNTARAAMADIASILRRYPFERIEMGYGAANHQSASLRLALVVASDHLSLDEAALSDMQLAGMRLPPATIDAMASCATPIWLIPKDEPPFSLPNIYGVFHPKVAPSRPLFDAEFREAFFRNYRRHESTEYFDVWKCD
jgi:hypothetical protein